MFTQHGTLHFLKFFSDPTIGVEVGTNVGYGGSTQVNHPRAFNGSIGYKLATRTGNNAGVSALSPTSVCAGSSPLNAENKKLWA